MEPLDPEVRAFIRRAMTEAVPDREVEIRMEAQLLAQVGAPDPSGTAGVEVATAGVGSAKVWVVAIAVGAGAIATGIVQRSESDQRATISATTTPSEPAAARPRATIPATRDASPSKKDPPVPAVASVPKAEPRVPARRSRTRPASPAAESDLAAELQIIRAAWKALEDGRTADTLELVRRHAHEHASGQLGPEREAIEAIARCREGDTTVAERFIARHARTKLAEKVRKQCSAMTDPHDDGTVKP